MELLDGFEAIFEAVKVIEATEDAEERQRKKDFCKETIQRHLDAFEDVDKAVKTIMYNIRVAFVKHPMDLIGRRLAARPRRWTGGRSRGPWRGCRVPSRSASR